MPKTVSKSHFKAKALELFREVEVSGQPVIVTDRGEPRLEIRRYRPPNRDPLAKLRGSVIRYVDPTEPVGADGWDVAD